MAVFGLFVDEAPISLLVLDVGWAAVVLPQLPKKIMVRTVLPLRQALQLLNCQRNSQV